jgi:hypothetical protein
MSASFADNKRRFLSKPTVNPETGRRITRNSDTQKNLIQKYGNPYKTIKTPTKKSPGKRATRSPARRSPSRTTAKSSPNRSPRSTNDMFAVLSPESIRTVYYKLTPDHQRAFLASSAHVRQVMGN